MGDDKLNTVMVIPTYWGREKAIGWQEGDAIYDHPTPLDEEGTLQRIIESTAILEDTDYQLVIIGVSTAADIEPQVERKVKEVLNRSSGKVRAKLFSHSHLRKVKQLLEKKGRKDLARLLSLRGYANVRNMCLFAAHLFSAEVVILIDDDELFHDPHFLAKARQFIGKTLQGKPILAVAGYYVDAEENYLCQIKKEPWMTYWDKNGIMNRAFQQIIGEEPRLKETPFVFGGNMVLHRELFTRIPFDPGITRGEDIDYLINARMFGYPFFLDNQRSIKHLPPPKPYPLWRRLREDIYRFVYERAKIALQKSRAGMTRVEPESLDPYPGEFLKGNLPELIYKSNLMLAAEYLQQGDPAASQECLRNIYLAQFDATPKNDPFDNLVAMQKSWSQLMEFSASEKVSSELKEALFEEASP